LTSKERGSGKTREKQQAPDSGEQTIPDLGVLINLALFSAFLFPPVLFIYLFAFPPPSTRLKKGFLNPDRCGCCMNTGGL